MASLQRNMKYYTYGEYLTCSGDQREELIDGVLYVSEPPAPLRTHQEVVGELYHQVRRALDGKSCRAYIAPFDVRLPKSNEPDEVVDTVVQPDVLVVCDQAKLDERGMRGAPDWLAEVLSPSTAGYDQSIKLAAYERAGVPEVWLIHPTDRTLAIYRLGEGRYGRPVIQELKGQTTAMAVPRVTVDWDRLALQLI